MSLHENLNKATRLVSTGDLGGAVLHYRQVLGELFQRRPASAGDATLLIEVGGDLTELLRWHHRYDEAIDLQLKLADALSDHERDFALQAATLRIESGEVEQGLADLILAAQGLDPHGSGLLLGATYAWLDRPDQALQHLRPVLAAPSASASDRAAASHMMFQILGARKEIPAAVSAWTMARTLDGKDQEHLPELLRMLIYWYQYDAAATYVHQLKSEIHRTYFRTILDSKLRALPSRHDWDWIHRYDRAGLGTDLEAYGEAALRAIAPDLALAALMPRIEAGELSRRELLLAGLAFAQQRDISRATWALDQALRLADLERPRRTRPGGGVVRIFDAETRILYGEIPIDGDLRALIDHYFMPRQQQN